MQFIDPRSDYAFKKIFGNDSAHDILISFLNAVMKLEGERSIESVVILNPYEAPKIKELKHSFLDVKCTDYRGVHYVVEMQVEYVKGFIKRVVYNSSKAYVNQIEQGEDYPRLNQVVAINILDFIMFEDERVRYLSHHLIKESETNESYLNEISYYFIELPKFNKRDNELQNNLEKWVFFIKNAGNLDYIPKSLQVEVFKKAFEIANRASMSREEWELYDQSLVLIQDQRGAVEAALEKGERIGIEKGERLGKLEIARNLLKLGVDLKVVLESTGIPEEELRGLGLVE
ncbi:MAG: Rpn family recombination-promoting nuclease/putative transposase [bacterium]